MKKRYFSKIAAGLTIFYAWGAFAVTAIQVQVDQKVPHGRDVGVGSRLTMKIPSSAKNVSGVFLGKMIDPSGAFSKYMLLDETNSKMYLANKENVEIGRYSFQSILKPYDQVGGTCTGYAIDHFFQQFFWSGYEGNGKLRTELSTEKGRTQLLVDSINEYYLVLQHRYSIGGVMNKMATRFGGHCKSKVIADAASAVNYLHAQLQSGMPVLIAFNIGPAMAESPIAIVDYESKAVMDDRLWVPRKKGERASGGHTIVAASMFEFKGRPFLLTIDSDWSEPRVWDVNAYFTAKTAMDEMEFITCQ